MSGTEKTAGELDPFAPWRSLRDATMDAWAKSMAEAVNTEAFAQNLGAYLNTYLATSAPLQKFVEQYMEATLSRLSMPTRDEVIDLARRMTSIETRLDDLDAKSDQITRALGQIPAAPNHEAALAALDARLVGLEARTGELLGLLQQLPGQLAASAAPAAEAGSEARSARKGRGRSVPNSEPPAPEGTEGA